MMNQKKYIMQSLELHLFFARIMKEHSLFLEAGFTPPGAALAKKAEWFKTRFEMLLCEVVRLSDGVVGTKILNSGEIVTPFTLNAENQTKRFTGISIDTNITDRESNLRSTHGISENTTGLFRKTASLNRTALRLINGLISFKEHLLSDVRSCRNFTMNYPLLIEHILREAKLYRTYIIAIENGMMNNHFMKDTERFWNQIMMEHAMFIRGLLDPSEDELIKASDSFAKEYAMLLEQARRKNDTVLSDLTRDSLEETLRFRDFKQAGTIGIQNCEIQSVILPLLADHVLREANHYIRLLESK